MLALPSMPAQRAGLGGCTLELPGRQGFSGQDELIAAICQVSQRKSMSRSWYARPFYTKSFPDRLQMIVTYCSPIKRYLF
jgi:hypothetical protein